MQFLPLPALLLPVAPLAGAWIEIRCLHRSQFLPLSLPSRERGLKCERLSDLVESFMSLPSRERGLKFEDYEIVDGKKRRSPRGSVD